MSEKVESNEVAGNMAEKIDTETTAIEGLLMAVAETNEISKDIDENIPEYEETTEEPIEETTKNNDENMSEKSETSDMTKNIDENMSEKIETVETTKINDENMSEKSEATRNIDENMSEKSETKEINKDEKISETKEDPYFDDNLVDLIEKCEGGVPEFIDKMFHFLSRKTDFYTGNFEKGKSSKSIVMEAFKKYDQGKENDISKKRKINDDSDSDDVSPKKLTKKKRIQIDSDSSEEEDEDDKVPFKGKVRKIIPKNSEKEKSKAKGQNNSKNNSKAKTQRKPRRKGSPDPDFNFIDDDDASSDEDSSSEAADSDDSEEMGREIRMIYDVDDFDSEAQSSNSDANLLDESESGSDTSSDEGEDDDDDAEEVKRELSNIKEDIESSSKPQPKKSTPKKDKEEKEMETDPEIYAKLIDKLKEYMVDKDLTDSEIIDQFETTGSDVDPEMSVECVCGKEGLKYLYFIKNKVLRKKVESEENGDDLIENATTTLTIGSKYIKHWYISRHKLRMDDFKTKNPIEFEFMKFLENGIIGNFREEIETESDSTKNWLITISSPILFKEFDAVKKYYNLKIDKKQNDAIDVKIIVESEKLDNIKKNYSGEIDKDSRHRFFLKFKSDETSENDESRPGINFYLEDLQNPESQVFPSSEPTS